MIKNFMYKFKKGIEILKNKGINAFVKRIILLTKMKSRSVLNSFQPIYFNIFGKIIKNKLSNFSSDDPEKTFNFISNNFLFFFSPMQIKKEFLELLSVFKNENPKVIMEIGTARGGTLFCFSKLAATDATIISLDLPGGEFGGGYKEWQKELYEVFPKDKQELFLLRENAHSEETLQKVKDVLKNKQIDFLFIDGDHTYAGVKQDFEMYSPLVKKGGIIAFHDIAIHTVESGCTVNVFWDEIKNGYTYKEFIADKNQGWCGIGCLFLKNNY